MSEVCLHDLAERETMVADGMCPACQAHHLNKRIRELEEPVRELGDFLYLSNYDTHSYTTQRDSCRYCGGQDLLRKIGQAGIK